MNQNHDDYRRFASLMKNEVYKAELIGWRQVRSKKELIMFLVVTSIYNFDVACNQNPTLHRFNFK